MASPSNVDSLSKGSIPTSEWAGRKGRSIGVEGPAMDALWEALRQGAELYAGRVAGAAVILLVGLLALRYLVGPLGRLLERGRLQPTLASFLVNSARGLLLVVIILGVLQQLGVETASLLTVLAAGGLAVALSLQNTLANFTAGLLLLSFRMLRVGDLIDTGPLRGRVTDLLPFHVVLVSDDEQVIVVPNTILTGNGFRNLSARPARRAQWTLPVRAATDLAAAKEALRGRLLADPRVLREPPPRVFVQEWGDDRRVLAVQAWCSAAEHSAVQDEMLEALGLALEALRTTGSDGTQAASS
jgi:small conductance mechanosensitive channel